MQLASLGQFAIDFTKHLRTSKHQVKMNMNCIESNKSCESNMNPFDLSSLINAAFLCTKNVTWKESVSLWMSNYVSNCTKLANEISKGDYRLSDPIVFHIKDPKPRTISAMKFRDRVVQRSMCECGLYEDLTRDLIYDNCACQKGKGVTFAIDRLKHHLHKYYNKNHTNGGWVVRLDVRKYFPSIPHELLKEEVKKRVSNPEVVKMVNHIIDEAVKIECEDDLSFNSDGFGVRGIGLGSQISQLLALAYLSDLDHYVTEQMPEVMGYTRYMDDMIMFARTKADAKAAYDKIQAFIEKKGLKLNPKSKISRLDLPLEFLKVIFRLTPTGKVCLRGTRKSLNREIHALNVKIKMFKEGRLSYNDLLQHTNTWFGYAIHRCGRRQVKFIKNLIKKKFEGFEKVKLATKAQ